jgi:hypothetical protein
MTLEFNEISLPPENRSKIGSVIGSMQARDRESLVAALTSINEFLTNNNQAHFLRPEVTAEEVDLLFSNIDEEDGGEHIFYLGDGGLSRLSVGIEHDGEPFIDLTPNSTDPTKKKWQLLIEEHNNESLGSKD